MENPDVRAINGVKGSLEVNVSEQLALIVGVERSSEPVGSGTFKDHRAEHNPCPQGGLIAVIKRQVIASDQQWLKHALGMFFDLAHPAVVAIAADDACRVV